MSSENRSTGHDLPGDEQLSAWLDGGLDADGNAKMADLAARNEDVAARAARLRRMDELVRAAVPEEETIPPELLARLGLAQPEAASAAPAAQVIDLAAARAARPAPAPASAPARAPAPRAWFTGMGRIAAQLVLISGLGLGVMLALGHDRQPATPGAPTEASADYRVLGDASRAAPAANALVRFAPGIDAAQAAALARTAGASMVGAPSAAGTARLAIAPARRDAVLARLRATPGVILAEPLDGTGQ